MVVVENSTGKRFRPIRRGGLFGRAGAQAANRNGGASGSGSGPPVILQTCTRPTATGASSGSVFRYDTYRVFLLLRRCASSRRGRHHYRIHLRGRCDQPLGGYRHYRLRGLRITADGNNAVTKMSAPCIGLIALLGVVSIKLAANFFLELGRNRRKPHSPLQLWLEGGVGVSTQRGSGHEHSMHRNTYHSGKRVSL